MFAIKVELQAKEAKTLVFTGQKTMYDGKLITDGDTVYIFDSGNGDGGGLWGRGRVMAAEALPRAPGLARQTPRVSITVGDVARAIRPLARMELKHFKDWQDSRPETELNFKFYRQATNKIVGLSRSAAGFLESFFLN